jgi:hypothetical protein
MAPFVAQYLYVVYGLATDCRWIVYFHRRGQKRQVSAQGRCGLSGFREHSARWLCDSVGVFRETNGVQHTSWWHSC